MPEESVLTRLCMIIKCISCSCVSALRGLPLFYLLLFGFHILREHVEGVELLICWHGVYWVRSWNTVLHYIHVGYIYFIIAAANYQQRVFLFFSCSTGTLYHIFPELPRRKVWPCWSHLLLSVPGLEKLPERHIWCQGTLLRFRKLNPLIFKTARA